MADRYNIDFLETSSKEDSNIEQVFKLLTETVISRGALQQKESDHVPLHDKSKKVKKNDSCC